MDSDKKNRQTGNTFRQRNSTVGHQEISRQNSKKPSLLASSGSSKMNKSKVKHNERGGAGVKLVAILVILFLVGHAGLNYVPVAYSAESFKSEMYTAVVQGLAMPGRGMSPVDAVKERVQRAARSNDIPEDAVMDVKMVNKVVQARVVYTKTVNVLPLGIYTYNYNFDHTATPTGFLLKD